MALSHGNALNVRQSMDKNNLIIACIIVLVIMSSLMGYMVGIGY